MKLSRPTPRQVPETVVPLIDVVFFLLVFAMLIGRMDATTPFEVSPPISSRGQDLPAGGATVAIGTEGEMSLNGGGIEQNAALGVLQGLVIEDPELRIRIQADATTPLRHLLPLLDGLTEVGTGEVVLVVTPEAAR